MAKSKKSKGVLRGAKTNRNSHSTMIPEAITAVKIAKECLHVTKVSLGLIERCSSLRGKKPHLKFVDMGGGLRMQVRGQDAVQFIWIYTKAPKETMEFVMTKWGAK